MKSKRPLKLSILLIGIILTFSVVSCATLSGLLGGDSSGAGSSAAKGNKLTIDKGWGSPDVYIYELKGNSLTILNERYATDESSKTTLTRQ